MSADLGVALMAHPERCTCTRCCEVSAVASKDPLQPTAADTHSLDELDEEAQEFHELAHALDGW